MLCYLMIRDKSLENDSSHQMQRPQRSGELWREKGGVVEAMVDVKGVGRGKEDMVSVGFEPTQTIV